MPEQARCKTKCPEQTTQNSMIVAVKEGKLQLDYGKFILRKAPLLPDISKGNAGAYIEFFHLRGGDVEAEWHAHYHVRHYSSVRTIT